MPSNIEIKARISDPARKRELARCLADSPAVIIQQQDTFFPCSHGRLKLRRFSETDGELIGYSRPDVPGAKKSDYTIYPTHSPGPLLRLLSAALGIGPVVTKTRELFLDGQTRIHLDSVEGLGWFLELEVVLKEGQAVEDGQRIARELMVALEIREEDWVDCAYADLLNQSPQPGQRLAAVSR